jgi:ubiquinone/menaquinone biosynthesis C-methylase UbiE
MSTGNQKVKPPLAYGPLTPLYDAVNDALGFGRSLLRRVVALVDPKEGERLLDLACGTGTLLDELVSFQPRLFAAGLEPDGQALAVARRKVLAAGGEVRLVQGVGQRLPFADASLDVVTSTMAFHHMSTLTKRQTVAEVHRVLRVGGRFVLVDFGRPSGLLAAVLLNVGSLFDGRENMRANLRGEIPWLLNEGGFMVREVAPPSRGVRFLLAAKRGQSTGVRAYNTPPAGKQERPACCGAILTSR